MRQGKIAVWTDKPPTPHYPDPFVGSGGFLTNTSRIRQKGQLFKMKDPRRGQKGSLRDRTKRLSSCQVQITKRAKNPYKVRNTLLRSLGFDSYQNYLQSELWGQIRGQVLSRDSFTCCVCKKFATEVHHRSYTKAGLTGESLNSMQSVCGDCHQRAEIDEFGRKRTLEEANEIIPSYVNSNKCVICRKSAPKGKKLCRTCAKSINPDPSVKLLDTVTVQRGRKLSSDGKRLRPRCPNCSKPLSIKSHSCSQCGATINWVKG